MSSLAKVDIRPGGTSPLPPHPPTAAVLDGFGRFLSVSAGFGMVLACFVKFCKVLDGFGEFFIVFGWFLLVFTSLYMFFNIFLMYFVEASHILIKNRFVM